MNQLTNITKYTSAVSVTAGAAGATAVNGDIIDTAGFEGAAFLVQVGAVVAGAVTSVKLTGSAAADMSGAADIAGLSLTIADTDDGGIKVLDYRRPAYRYLRLVVSRATQNATVTAIAALYGARDAVVAQPTTTATALASG
jgi:hypothetical protein